MKRKLAFGILLIMVMESCLAFDVKILRNDKELSSTFIRNHLVTKAKSEVSNYFGTQMDFNSKFSLILADALSDVSETKGKCDLRLVQLMRQELDRQSISMQKNDFDLWLHLAREQNLIDDILASMLARLNTVDSKLHQYSNRPYFPHWRAKVRHRISDKKELLDLYRELGSKWPDGQNNCPLDYWSRLASIVKKEFKVKPGNMNYLHSILASANLYAYQNKIISQENWNRLEVFRHAKVLQHSVDIKKYLDTMLNAKDKLINELNYIRRHDPEAVASRRTKRFLRTYVDRAMSLTRRAKLYEKFNSQQILLLSEILVKASKRMNADRSEIHIDYREGDSPNPDEIYVISPMEQYRMSLKMLRKDYANASLSSLFEGKAIEYEDIVMAALETGVITFDELDYVVQYENFWNPPAMRPPLWKQMLGYFMDFAGTASFYLPTPFNLVGAIGLVFTETLLFKKKQNINSQGNANSIFK